MKHTSSVTINSAGKNTASGYTAATMSARANEPFDASGAMESDTNHDATGVAKAKKIGTHAAKMLKPRTSTRREVSSAPTAKHARYCQPR